MGINYNADEIFEMAIRAERNATKMYGDLAEKHKDPAIVDELKKLSAMEAEHERIFMKLREELPEHMRTAMLDPDDTATMYLDAVADASVAEGSPKTAEKMTGEESFAEILRMAVDAEKQAVLFYLGIRDMVPERLGRDKIEAIIKEEQMHAAVLTKRLKSL